MLCSDVAPCSTASPLCTDCPPALPACAACLPPNQPTRQRQRHPSTQSRHLDKQCEMQGDVTSQRRWEAYDKLGTFGIYAVSVVLVIQVRPQAGGRAGALCCAACVCVCRPGAVSVVLVIQVTTAGLQRAAGCATRMPPCERAGHTLAPCECELRLRLSRKATLNSCPAGLPPARPPGRLPACLAGAGAGGAQRAGHRRYWRSGHRSGRPRDLRKHPQRLPADDDGA